MNGFRSACIINKPKENVKAAKIQGFFKWIGISYVTLISKEDNVCHDPVLKENRECLDVTVYLKEEETTFYNWTSQSFEKTVIVDENQNTTYGIVSFILRNLYQTVMEVQSDSVFEELISIYEKYSLSSELANIDYSLKMHSDIAEDDYNIQKNKWENIIKDLEKIQQEELDKNREYLKHALIYSKRKVNELCNLLSFARIYSTQALCEETDEIYEYDEEFYEAECLKSKIVLLDSQYQLLSVLYLQRCIERCPVAACRSFYYYRLGKQYEIHGRRDRAVSVYEKAYKTNSANVRALFKLGVYHINKREFEIAEQYFLDILKCLHLTNVQEDQLVDQINELSAIELEYASKSYILLAKIARLDDQGIRYELHLYEQARKIADSLDDNVYLKEMYSDEKERNRVKKCLEGKLALENIKKKLQNIGSKLTE